jgi:hypothetical protein
MSKTQLSDLVKVLRSKNAGPSCLTLDLFFHNSQCYQSAVKSETLSIQSVAALYEVSPDTVLKFEIPQINAIKFSLPRKLIAGTPGDSDLYGAQQHGHLLRIKL